MENKHSKLALMLMTLVLLLALAFGPAASGVAGRVVGPRVGMVDGLHGLLAQPFGGGGSSGG